MGIFSVCSSEVEEGESDQKQDEFVQFNMEFDGSAVRRLKVEGELLDEHALLEDAERRLLEIEDRISKLESMQAEWDNQAKRRLQWNNERVPTFHCQANPNEGVSTFVDCKWIRNVERIISSLGTNGFDKKTCGGLGLE